MIDMGVDGIISDHPELLRKVAGDKGITLPVETPVTPSAQLPSTPLAEFYQLYRATPLPP
jgi:hypothetical protein